MTPQVWRVSRATLARIKAEIVAEEALCVTQDQIDAASPRVMRRLFPGMDAAISVAIATGRRIHFKVIEDASDAG